VQGLLGGAALRCLFADDIKPAVDASTVRGKVMCGYQGWFRCPGDGADLGWVHWSRDRNRLAPSTLTFEMWPDMTEYPPDERYPAPGFSHPDGRGAYLFSSASAGTVERHFEWMRDYGIDGAWLQHFVVDLPGGPIQDRYPTRLRVLNHVRESAEKTGRVWALSYDIAGMPNERIYEVLTSDWKKVVDEKFCDSPRYVHQGGRPVVQIWGFYRGSPHNLMTAELARKLIDFFKTPGPYSAYLVGGGDWNWRTDSDAQWRDVYRSFNAYVPWNIGNYATDQAGVKHASMNYWREDKRECERNGVLWIPSVYPGFSWDNLRQQPAGTTTIPRRGGRFFWEQFHELAKLEADTVFVAMFDEVDEATAIFKVSSTPPVEGHFVGYEDLPSDWYLRLTGEGIRMLRGQRAVTAELPIRP
jgi:hypothetical protein